jgi:hypothetical protein
LCTDTIDDKKPKNPAKIIEYAINVSELFEHQLRTLITQLTTLLVVVVVVVLVVISLLLATTRLCDGDDDDAAAAVGTNFS